MISGKSFQNKTIEILNSHTSIRKFDPNFIIPKNDLNTIIEAGQHASTSALLQMYTIIEIPKEDRQEEDTICGTQQFIKDSSFFGILFADFYRVKRMVELSGGKYDQNYKHLELTMGIMDVGLMAQNMAIAAESLGYGICYCGACGDSGDKIFKNLNIPEKVLPLAGFAIGKPLEEPKLSPRLPSHLIHHVGKYKDYTDDELIKGMDFISEKLSEKRGKPFDWKQSLKSRFEGVWAPNREQKRKNYIQHQFDN